MMSRIDDPIIWVGDRLNREGQNLQVLAGISPLFASRLRVASKVDAPQKGIRLMAERSTSKTGAKRELIAPNGDKRFVRRDEQGRFDEVDDVGRSLSQDVRKKAKTQTTGGQGDKGDRKSSS